MASRRALGEHTFLPRIGRSSQKSVVMVLCDDTARQQLEGGARVFAERRFSRSAAFAELAAVLMSILGAGRSTTPVDERSIGYGVVVRRESLLKAWRVTPARSPARSMIQK